MIANDKINISFVVLHYNNFKYTKACIESLKKYINKVKNVNVNIIVVDNGSTRYTLNRVAKENNNNNIFYVISKKNLGFAKGNNLGFSFAKSKLKSDIIILTNSDTVYKQENFIEKLVKHYKNGFDVAGPKILTKNGTVNQNPIFHVLDTKKKVKAEIWKYKILNTLATFGVDNIFMTRILPNLRKKKPVITAKNNNFKLHGACLIFANNYVKKLNGLYPKTFMYGEEDFLWYLSHIYNFKMEYFNDLVVFHKGNATTDSVYGKGRIQRRYYYKWSLDSYKKLIYLMNKE